MLALEIIGALGILYGVVVYVLVKSKVAQQETQASIGTTATTGGAR